RCCCTPCPWNDMEPPHSPFRPSRRGFLATLPLLAAAASCRGRPFRRRDFLVPDRSSMAILPADRYDADLTDVIYRGLEILGASVTGRRVFLKPNMVEYEAGTAINTHPGVIAGAAAAFLKAGAREVVVGEGPGHRRDVEYLLTSTGFDQVLTDNRLRFI